MSRKIYISYLVIVVVVAVLLVAAAKLRAQIPQYELERIEFDNESSMASALFSLAGERSGKDRILYPDKITILTVARFGESRSDVHVAVTGDVRLVVLPCRSESRRYGVELFANHYNMRHLHYAGKLMRSGDVAAAGKIYDALSLHIENEVGQEAKELAKRLKNIESLSDIEKTAFDGRLVDAWSPW